ncbi:hypothetical protein NYO98_00295 [Nocardioides sp. STR2]|uniref:Uncharacterized protein n=1 Tax=Nocardioides pini TaxID=2975053 RepID=A0ABT4C6V9_9ACTN|nr:hypothetical protein [Nocardioides pini]MCY4724699.1 hypothetical protein [Nocardioides pini]
MSPSDDRSQDPWTDPQTHLDTDPVNADPAPPGPDATGETDQPLEDES